MGAFEWTALVAFALLIGYRSLAGRRSPAQMAVIRAEVADGGLIVDVRSRAEYAAGHIDGSLNVPLDELGRRHADLGPATRAIAVCCASGARSRRARSHLTGAGFSRVMDLGPWRNWLR